MTKNFCDALNMPSIREETEDNSDIQENFEFPENTFVEIEKLSDALSDVDISAQAFSSKEEGLEIHDREMNEIYKQALKVHKDMLDFGYNVEARHSGNIFEPAARFLEIAMNASKSKSEQRLKVLKMRLDKQKLEIEKLRMKDDEEIIEANDINGVLLDRNDLISNLVSKLKDSKK